MRANKLVLMAMLLTGAGLLPAQVVAPVEIADAQLRALQQQSLVDLTAVGHDIAGHSFAFPFYLSRKLDIDEKEQKRTDQHSVRIDRYNGATVLAVSGNYYGAYAADKFTQAQRVRATFLEVIVPIVRAAAPRFEGNSAVQGYAIEVSHHVIAKTMGMPIERAENVMVYFPQNAAARLAAAQNNFAMQGALIDASVFVNAEPMNLWLTDDAQAEENDLPPTRHEPAKAPPAGDDPVEKAAAELTRAAAASAAPPSPVPESTPASTPAPAIAPAVSAPAPAALPQPMRDSSPQALAALQLSIQGASNHMLKELEPEAHFVSYAPPAFIGFHRQVFLELSVTTPLVEPPGASRYKLAALAFDEHIAPLLRRVLAYFPPAQSADRDFDGISFSTTVRGRVKPGMAQPKPLSVEFFFPMEALRRYETYDCTGQQLIDAGIVLINGERSGLDLQIAQGGGKP